MQLIYMFSGQGSQYFQMGKTLYEQSAVFRKNIEQLDQMFHDLQGISLLTRVYASHLKISDPFDQTRDTHPAIFMFQYALFKTLLEKGLRLPDQVIGYSMGEFVAAAVAEVLTPEEALYMVVKQANALEDHAGNGGKGGMLAVCADPERYANALSDFGLELAAVNFDKHFIVSGRMDDIVQYENKMKQANLIVQRLPVSQAFHSSLIEPAKDHFMDEVKNIRGKNPAVKMMTPTTGNEVNDFDAEHYWVVIRDQVDFKSLIKQLEKKSSHVYLDVGFTGTMANFVKYNLPVGSESWYYSTLTPFDSSEKKLNELIEKFR